MSWAAEAETEHGLEAPRFFGAAGRRKYAVFHEPRPGGPVRAPIVLCAPHFEEKLWAHRVLVDAAREACRRGHPAMRFDVSGHGDSEGEFEDFSLSDFEEDTVEAWQAARTRTGAEPVLVGLRLGGTLAARVAARVGARAVLWEPILDLGAWVQEMLRANLTFQIRHFGRVMKNRAQLAAELQAGQTVTLEGYGLTSRFFLETASWAGWGDTAFPGGCPEVLTVAFRGRGVAPATALEEAAGRWSAATRSTFRIVDEEAVWSDVRRYRTRAPGVISASLDWIDGERSGESS